MLEDFKAWLKVFGRWLTLFNSSKAKRPKPLVTYERYLEGDNKVLESRLSLLVDNDSRFHRPGAIATWNLINREFPHNGVLITLDNLFRLTAELDPKHKGTDTIKRGLERSLGLTHRFQVSWVVGAHSKFSFVLIDSFDIDLSSQFVDESARDIIRYAAIDAFSMRIIPTIRWSDRIYHFPWYETIRQLSPRKGCPENPRYRRLCRRIQKVTFS